MSTVAHSYQYCRKVARSRARNFYYSFVLLPGLQKDAMCAIYAFMRYCDDLSDEPGAQRAALDRWRIELDRTLAGDFGSHPVWPAFHDTVQRFRIPHKYFHDMIDGVTSDLDWKPVETFEELYRYCYRVASVVGLTVVHIFGYRTAEALPLAEQCGVAFQLTNILRDIREDADRGRIYLPSEDLARFGVDLTDPRPSDEFRALMRFEAARARAYYDRAAPLTGMVDPACRASLWALIQIYSQLLDRIEKSNYDVLTRRIRLSSWEKAWTVVRARWASA